MGVSKKNAFSENSNVRFSVVRKVFYTFLYHKKIWFALAIIPTLVSFIILSPAEAEAAQRVDAAALELEMANRIESMLDMLIGEDRAIVKVELTLTEVSPSTAPPQRAAIETLRPLGLPGMLTARPVPGEEGPETVPPPSESGTLIPLITSISVNILVDESVTEEKINLIKELVPQWIGLDYNRGDTLAVSPVPWRDVTKEEKEAKQLKLTEMGVKLSEMGVFSNLATVGTIAAIFITVLIFSLIFRKQIAKVVLAGGGGGGGAGGPGAGGAAGPEGEPSPAEKSATAIKSEVGRVADVVGGLSKELGKFQESLVGGGGGAASTDKLEGLLGEIKDILSKTAPAGAAKGGEGGGGGSPEVLDALRGIQELLKSGAVKAEGGGGGPALESPFKFINTLSAQDIKRILEGEPEEMCVQIIAHLKPKKTAELFSVLEPEARDRLVTKVAGIDESGKEPDQDSVIKVRDFLERKMKSIRLFTDFAPAVGSEVLAESLSLASTDVAHAMLEKLKKENPELAAETRKKLFLFEDIAKLDDRTISLILVEIDRELLKVALKGGPKEVNDKVLGSMSERGAAMLKEDLEIMTDLPKERYEEAQKKILETIKQMEKSGRIKLPTSKT